METITSSAPAARSSGRLTAVLGGIVVVIGVLFAFESSFYENWYALFRVAHVVVAVFWVGGGVLLTVLGLRAERSSDPNEIATLVRQAALTGEKLFAPAGGIVFLMGIAMMINTDWGWGKFWVVVGLLGYAITFITGVAVLSPLAKKIDALIGEKGPDAPETQAAIQRILLVARADATILLLAVADMVTKPFSSAVPKAAQGTAEQGFRADTRLPTSRGRHLDDSAPRHPRGHDSAWSDPVQA